MAMREAGWVELWDNIDDKLRGRLAEQGLDDPLIWAGLRGDRGRLQGILNGMQVLLADPAEHTADLDSSVLLQAAARIVGAQWLEGASAISVLQLVTETEAKAKRQKTDLENRLLFKLQAIAAIHKPVEWRLRRYRRAEQDGDENARKKAEAADREKWMRKIFGLLQISGTPFGVEATTKGWHYASPDAARCYRGVRSATLKKRCSDIGPYLRWLHGETGKRFPDEISDILKLLSVRQEEQAARSVYSTLETAVAYFEDAGEIPKQVRLSLSSGVLGAVK